MIVIYLRSLLCWKRINEMKWKNRTFSMRVMQLMAVTLLVHTVYVLVCELSLPHSVHPSFSLPLWLLLISSATIICQRTFIMRPRGSFVYMIRVTLYQQKRLDSMRFLWHQRVNKIDRNEDRWPRFQSISLRTYRVTQWYSRHYVCTPCTIS